MNVILVRVIIGAISGAIAAFGIDNYDFNTVWAALIGLATGWGFLRMPGDTKKLVPLIALGLLLCTSACKEGGFGDLVWPKTVQCGSTLYDAAPVVSRILFEDGIGKLSDENKSELVSVAKDIGTSALACVIETLIREWRARGAALTPEAIAASKRGEDFLSEMGVEYVQLE